MVHVVAEEPVTVGVGRKAGLLEYAEEVRLLAVYVAVVVDGGVEFKEGGLGE